MTEIKYDSIELCLTIKGHAGYAKAGEDIVCAGVSALFYAAYSALRERGFKFFADLDEAEGFAQLRAYPNAEERHTCLVIFETVVAGLNNLAQHYPENVHIVKEAKQWH